MRLRRREHVASLPENVNRLMFLRPPGPVAALVPEEAAIGLYHATGDEAPTLAYAKWFHENGRSLALPWFADRESPMVFRKWADPHDPDSLMPGPFGAMQPPAGAEQVTPDVIFVPLLAFTADGHRLGQGGGHYDRWLEAHPETLPLGLAWDCQLVDHLPSEEHDWMLRAVITPSRLFEKGD